MRRKRELGKGKKWIRVATWGKKKEQIVFIANS